MALLYSVSYFLFSYQSLSLWMVFGAVSFNIEDEFLSINPSAHVFVFVDFSAHHKDCLTYSGETDRPGEIVNGLTHMVNFPTWIPNCDWLSPALLDFFLPTIVFDLVFSLENLIMLLPQFPMTSLQTKKGKSLSIPQLITTFVLTGTIFMII